MRALIGQYQCLDQSIQTQKLYFWDENWKTNVHTVL